MEKPRAEDVARMTQQLCRLCAEAKDSKIGIYGPEGQRLAIDTKIAKCLQIQASAYTYYSSLSLLLACAF